MAQVYVRCLIARISYRMCASAMERLGSDEAFLMGDALEWSSPFSDTVNALSCRVYASLSSQMMLPGYAWDILQPPDANRFRIFDPSLTGPAIFVVSIVKSIQNTHNGMKLKDGNRLKLPPHLHILFSKWEISTRPLFVLFHTVAAQHIERLNASEDSNDMTDNTTLHSLVFSSHVYRL